MSTEYTAVPLEDPEKAQLLDLDGAPACEVAPPQYQSRESCGCAHRMWGRRWMKHHHCDHGDGHPHPSPHHPNHSQRRCPFFFRFFFRLFFFLVGIHIVFHGIHHIRNWRHGRFGGKYNVEEWHDDYFSGKGFEFDLSERESDHFAFASGFWDSEEGHPRPSRHPRRPPSCDPDDLRPWDGTNEFSFSPEDFGALVVKQHGVTDHGEIFLHQSADVDEVTVSVSVLIANDKLASEINVVAHGNEENGVYVVEVRSPPRDVGAECIKLIIDVAFPRSLESFKTFVKGANVDVVAESVSRINFKGIVLHTLNGTVKVEDLRADKALLGALHGRVEGSIDILDKIQFGVGSGCAEVKVNPDITDSPVKIKGKVFNGYLHLKVPSESYSGPFKVATFVGRAGVSAEDSESLVVEKSKRNFAVGYYDEKDTDSLIIVEGVHSHVNLTFV